MAGTSYSKCVVLSVLLLIQIVHAHTPSRNGTLTIVGDEPTILLDICEGDCDSDADCHPGLKCFQRNANQRVPGCTGDRRSYSNWDFCYLPPTKAPTKAPIVPTTPPTKAPIVPTTLPTKAPTRAPTKAPTIAPTRAPTKVPTKAPIVPTKVPTQAPLVPTNVPTKAPLVPTNVPTQAPIVPTKAPTKSPTRAPTKVPTRAPTNAQLLGILRLSDAFPLGKCQGDCDSDSDCQPGLRCFQRNGNTRIPGCIGDRRSFRGYDFCYRP